jgi:ATP-dependent protease ClpP protease subunit
MARSTRHSALVDALCMRLTGWRNAHPVRDTAPDPDGRTWYRFENKADATAAVLHLYDEIGAWGVTADAFMTDLAEIGSRDITLRINSPGGEVFDGVAIFNALQRHSGQITGHVDGLAASAASFIAMACDTLVMEPGTQMMIHDAQGMCWGDEAGALELAKMLGRTSNTIAMIYAERAGGTAEEWRERMRATTWYDGAEAVEAQLADRVGESRARDADRGEPVKDALPAVEPAPVPRPAIVLPTGTVRRRPERRPLAFRHRAHLTNDHSDQLRGEDGRWVDMPGTGVPWDSYVEMYDVYDESATPSGLAIVTMKSGDMQFAFDDAEDASVRHVISDFGGPDDGPEELRNALQSAVDSDTVEDIELSDGDGGNWAVVTRNTESITLFVPGSVAKNDFEIEIDLDEADALISAFDEQIARHGELSVEDTWTGLISALIDMAPDAVADPDTWTTPVWADAHSTSEPVSSPTDDHRAFWEAWA